jgi:thiamine-phosphate diphosphorylase
MPASLATALSLMREAHHGQKRRHGAPYASHPSAVRDIVDDLGTAAGIFVDDDTRAVALLHDVLEDNSDIGIDELQARFGAEVAMRVHQLTKQGKGDEATRWYYARLTKEANDATKLVKVADRAHNLSELQLAPDGDKLARYVEETLAFVVPLAQSAGGTAAPQRGRALVAALHDAIRAACRAQRRPLPDALTMPAARVPRGIYAIVAPAAGALQAACDDVALRCARLAEAGVVLLQVRDKARDARALCAVVEAAVAGAGAVPVLVNDRPDVAVAAGAAGVHVGQTDMAPFHARRVVGAGALVGVSTHDEAQLQQARDDDATDYVAVGPIYRSTTKDGHAPVVGTLALAARVRTTQKPVVAIGGVDSVARVCEVARAGAQLACALSLLAAHDPRPLARRAAQAFAATAAGAESP